jgi:phosphotransferase system enzyme I (PtsI)
VTEFRGIAAAPGVAVGNARLLDRRETRTLRYHILPDQADYEVERLRNAIEVSVAQLQSIRKSFTDGLDHGAILQAHEMMLRDPALVDEARQGIEGRFINAEWAVVEVLDRLRGLFDQVSDTYLRERRGDLDFVGDRILRNLRGGGDEVDVSAGSIIVAHDLSPADTALLVQQQVTAFVTEVGTKTSHASIIARSLGVPAVVGCHGVFAAVGNGDVMIVDGLQGRVEVRPDEAALGTARWRHSSFQRATSDLSHARALPAITVDGFPVRIMGNIELPSEIEKVLHQGGEGIGLYRTEFMFLGRRQAPGEEDHYRTYCQVFDEVGPRPVTVRTFDIGSDKVFGSAPMEQEANPALGLRAVRYCLQHPEVFIPQLKGLLRAGMKGDLRVMLPMISGVRELRGVRALVQQAKDELRQQGKDFRNDLPIGVMIEVPSAAMTADVLAKEADFFSVGSNDLMQYLLAIDRTNDRVAYIYDPMHPAMLRMMQRVATAAKEMNLPLSLCGEIAGDIEDIALLVGLGFDELSMNAGSIPQVKRLIRELCKRDCEALVAAVMECGTADEVSELAGQFLSANERTRKIWELTR